MTALSPWELGRALANRPGVAVLPTLDQLKSLHGLTDAHAALTIFAFHEARGRVYPPGFREWIEWLLRDRRGDRFEELVLALMRAPDNGTAKHLLDQFGLDALAELDACTGALRRHGGGAET